jgi:sigma-B regulation protein RsbU (phosphoserine phosphatase)
VARPTPRDRPVDATNGTIEGQQKDIAPTPGTIGDEQTLADIDQTLADGDQTLSDADQTGSDSDQTSAEFDQLAADRDQAASDHDLSESSVSAHEHDATRGIRERSSRQRDETARARVTAAGERDKVARARDLAALARDRAAEARALAGAQRDTAADEELGAGALSPADADIRATEHRRRAAAHRQQAAEQRELAALDRQSAARDREQAAEERRHALADRDELIAALAQEQERKERALRHQRRAETLSRTLQRSLSPPSLPRIAGLEVAVHYEPFAAEEVGGDFYDLFPLGTSRSGFFLGDVCGKGPEAAAITSLARYTMRTAAMLQETPDAILMDLNAALLQSTGPMQTCTVVYGQIDMTAADLAVITLAVAGHPAPRVVRANGRVEPTQAHGTVLGAIADPVFHMCEVRLQSGDAIVICSDGILDATIDGVEVDEEHVAELLSGTTDASAQTLVDRLISALQRIDRPLRDDVAIMAVRRTPS